MTAEADQDAEADEGAEQPEAVTAEADEHSAVLEKYPAGVSGRRIKDVLAEDGDGAEQLAALEEQSSSDSAAGEEPLDDQPSLGMTIEKLELSKTGTHLNVVTAADLEGAEAEAASPVQSIVGPMQMVKRAMDETDDAELVQGALPAADEHGHVMAPQLTDDPWNLVPGPWNGGKGKQPYGSSKRRGDQQHRSSGALPQAAPTQPLPLRQLARRAKSEMELEREAVVAALATRVSWHAMDEYGNAAAWVRHSKQRSSASVRSRAEEISADWKQHLADAKAAAIQKRLKNLETIRDYDQEVKQRPTGSEVTQQVDKLVKEQKEEMRRLRRKNKPPKVGHSDIKTHSNRHLTLKSNFSGRHLNTDLTAARDDPYSPVGTIPEGSPQGEMSEAGSPKECAPPVPSSIRRCRPRRLSLTRRRCCARTLL